MREVTDPAILAQLNAPSAPTNVSSVQSAVGLKEVTDPAILAQLDGKTAPAPAQSGFLNYEKQNMQDIGNQFGSLGQGVLGAGDALRNTIASGLNLLPGVNISPVQSGQGTAYDVGNVMGNIGAFSAGGEGLDAIRAAGEATPYLGKIAQWLGGSSLGQTMARQGFGSGIYGGITTNQDRTDNSIGGAAMGAGLAALPFGLGKVAQGLQYFQPQKYASQILDSMSGGQNMQDATKSVLSAVKTAYQNQKDEASDLYSAVNSSVPTSNIYENVKKPDPLMSLDPFAGYTGYYRPQETKFDVNDGINGNYPNLPQSFFNNYPTYDLNQLHSKFIENPHSRMLINCKVFWGKQQNS